METETCANCLHHIIWDKFMEMWLHTTSNAPMCDPEDSIGTVAEPRR